MSIIELKQKVSPLSDFNSDVILRELCIQPDQTAEIDAARYIFRQMLEYKSFSSNRLENNRAAIAATIEKLELRLAVIAEYKESFFGNIPHEHDALIIAALCDNLIIDANAPELNEHGAMTGKCAMDFDPETLMAAHQIFDQAAEIQGCYSSYLDHEHESLFLAHVNSLISMIETDEIKGDLGLEELQNYTVELRIMKGFACQDSAIGRQMVKLGDDMLSYIAGRTPSATILPFRQFGL